MGCIYKITNTVNGKAYIGQTYRDVETRVIQEHLQGNSPGCTLLTNAVKKHGAEKFTYEILQDGILPELLDIFEIEAIKLHKTLAPNGYNLQVGGRGGRWSEEARNKIKGVNNSRYGKSPWNKGKPHSEATRKKIREARKRQVITAETRRKMSEARRGRLGTMTGRKHSAETRRKMSKVHLGEKNHQFGKKRTAEHRRKISKANRGRKHSDETRKKMSSAHKGKPAHPNSLKALRSEETQHKKSEALRGEQNPRFSPMHLPTKQFYFSLPSDLDMTEKRKRVKEFCGKDPRTIWRWINQWEKEK